MFVSENFGFCALMKSFFYSITVVMVSKNSKIRVQNVIFVGKR